MITATMLVQNNEQTLPYALKALLYLDEVIILDTGSSDRSLTIAETFPNVKIFHSPFIGFGPLHNLAISYAKNSWILSIDSDEVLSLEASQELKKLTLDPECVYAFPFRNFFGGKEIVSCGWYPESKIRLFHKERARFSEDRVHEKVLFTGLNVCTLKHAIDHYSYRSIGDFLTKMQTYSTLFAEQNRGRKQSSLFLAWLKSWGAFFKSYILKRGIWQGREGYIISRYNADVAYYKYLKLSESEPWDITKR